MGIVCSEERDRKFKNKSIEISLNNINDDNYSFNSNCNRFMEGFIMKIFGFSKHLERWKRVEDEMYLIWIGNQSGAILPRFQDFDFARQMEKLKKKYTLSQCEKQLKIS